MNKDKVRIVILKETEKGELFKNINENNFKELDLGFDWNVFNEEVNFLVRENYLTKPFYADNTIYIYNSKLTEKGEEYLEGSKWYKKLYQTVKEIKEWISI
ncbi:YjcQ family protein [Ureibacillus sp. 179-F W5.1 NHS]|uniref:YjcQ family protein n=1 Tax=Ureibacillus sp. 179-F W5.1 NHS TaxID=3374297 RepID=UPI0038795229